MSLSNNNQEFLPLPRSTNSDGDIRRAGFELEYAGLDIEQSAQLVVNRFHGTIQRESRFAYTVAQTDFGDFHVEVDASLLKNKEYEQMLKSIGIELDVNSRETLEDALLELASLAVPFEVVTPPIPTDRCDEVEALRADFHKHKAQGTQASFLYGFGLHINVEAASLEADWLRDMLRSYLLLRHAIAESSGIDLTRRISPYIDDFPEEYVRTVLSPDYAPSRRQLIADYLLSNPTRNRSLDMLPLFASIEARLVMEHVDPEIAPLIKPRPAFHYRLPDCRIDDPQWRIAADWNRWVEVERLADDTPRLEKACHEYVHNHRGFPEEWLEWAARLFE
ncbi:amidoligase family protein [Desulfovibrio inopinatus]|uniref:amidoligase family protein n=1 Tax=Desulfovibrio inopinatus TaxID=102109 RepID=UPI000418E54D|nr:amidoligase family protein [Desulfovibrio inopinatus]